MKYLWLAALMTCMFTTTLASAQDDKTLLPVWNGCPPDDHRTSRERAEEEAAIALREGEVRNREFASDGGDSIFQDYGKAAKAWFQQMIEQGRTWVEARLAWFPAQLGEMYYSGTIFPQDYNEAIRLLQKAAEQGSALAQARLGEVYYSGNVRSQDYAQAARWFQKAARRGNASAQNSLGEMYYNGECVFRDNNKAFKWFKKAAEQENIPAQARLGEMYYEGNGVHQDYNKAFEWLEKAAMQGNTSAQDGLGVMYRDGKSVPQNLITAYAWFNVAAENSESAKKHRFEIQRDMTNSEIAEGQNTTNKFLEQIPKNN